METSIITAAACATILLLCASAMGLFNRGDKMPVEGKTVLLTGASEGMGLSVAQKLAARGANVILVSRNVVRLKEALTSLQAMAKNPDTQRFHYISADVSAPGYGQSVVAEAKRWNNGQTPDIVWCMAGVSVPELFVDMKMDSMRRQMDVNFFGTADMAHAILRHWLAAEAPLEDHPRHLIMTTSVVAFYTIPGYAPYAPSKWAIRGLADTISQEILMYPQNVKIHVVYPGNILSPGYERENRTKPAVTKLLEESDPKQTPDEVAEAAIRGLQRGDYFVTINFLGSLMKWGMLGGSFRNNWVVDTLGAWLVSMVWFFVQMDLHGKIKSYGKTHGHPSSYKKTSS
ncbi:hypothetical protein CDD80_1768 [Ophiocordyceps camponoti-rufipedis]|uniref:3-dehydrosphinganine reductase n=1 Tax=Ophiocordyceps camponoti-rufipedis TaxID=2004952 RepID=A0A2C5Z807_9HYPO|nr:hypothetical protein CDD80_1768 [Ophiocordyceps camponoti-rufipedis]